jgi:chromosome segregation ATPase
MLPSPTRVASRLCVVGATLAVGLTLLGACKGSQADELARKRQCGALIERVKATTDKLGAVTFTARAAEVEPTLAAVEGDVKALEALELSDPTLREHRERYVELTRRWAKQLRALAALEEKLASGTGELAKLEAEGKALAREASEDEKAENALSAAIEKHCR